MKFNWKKNKPLTLLLIIIVAVGVGTFINLAIDEYPFSNYDSTAVLAAPHPTLGWNADSAEAQSFTGNGQYVVGALIYARKGPGALPTGPVYAAIYSHTGTYGAGGLPGTELAVSEPIQAEMFPTITQNYQPVNFTFSGSERIQLADGVPFCIIVYGTDGIDLTNNIQVAFDGTPEHSGSYSRYRGGGWQVPGDSDLLFAVYGVDSLDGGTTPDPDPEPDTGDTSTSDTSDTTTTDTTDTTTTDTTDTTSVASNLPPEPSETDNQTLLIIAVIAAFAGVVLLKRNKKS